MKIARLIGILSILLQEDKTTAPELAERFEVSRRTINRDIEDLCKAGIPIRTVQGTGGGISIMEGYRMDRTILTSRDMQMILAGLRSLDSVSGSSYYGQLMEKYRPDLSTEKIFPGEIKVKALFAPDMKWRLVEEFGPHCFTEADDGRLLFTADYTDLENLVTWLMTFGAKAEVLEPAEARDIIRRNAKETLQLYTED